MKRLSIMSFALVCGTFFVAGANADRIGEDGFSGNETLINFDGMQAPPPGPFMIGDVTFTERSTGSGAPGWRVLAIDFNGPPSGSILTDNAGISDITLDFAVPQFRAGLWVGVGPATYQVDAFDANGNFLESASTAALPGTFDAEFVGFENAAGISSLHVTEPSGENGLVGGIDDVRFEIPEPTSVLLLIAGSAVGLLGRRRR